MEGKWIIGKQRGEENKEVALVVLKGPESMGGANEWVF